MYKCMPYHYVIWIYGYYIVMQWEFMQWVCYVGLSASQQNVIQKDA